MWPERLSGCSATTGLDQTRRTRRRPQPGSHQNPTTTRTRSGYPRRLSHQPTHKSPDDDSAVCLTGLCAPLTHCCLDCQVAVATDSSSSAAAPPQTSTDVAERHMQTLAFLPAGQLQRQPARHARVAGGATVGRSSAAPGGAQQKPAGLKRERAAAAAPIAPGALGQGQHGQASLTSYFRKPESKPPGGGGSASAGQSAANTPSSAPAPAARTAPAAVPESHHRAAPAARASGSAQVVAGQRPGGSSRRRDCHFHGTPCLSLLKHLMQLQGGCCQMTVSPMARWLGAGLRRPVAPCLEIGVRFRQVP